MNFFGKKGDTWGIILGENPTGHCFALRDLGPTSFFEIRHDCVTENARRRYKFLAKFI